MKNSDSVWTCLAYMSTQNDDTMRCVVFSGLTYTSHSSIRQMVVIITVCLFQEHSYHQKRTSTTLKSLMMLRLFKWICSSFSFSERVSRPSVFCNPFAKRRLKHAKAKCIYYVVNQLPNDRKNVSCTTLYSLSNNISRLPLPFPMRRTNPELIVSEDMRGKKKRKLAKNRDNRHLAKRQTHITLLARCSLSRHSNPNNMLIVLSPRERAMMMNSPVETYRDFIRRLYYCSCC